MMKTDGCQTSVWHISSVTYSITYITFYALFIFTVYVQIKLMFNWLNVRSFTDNDKSNSKVNISKVILLKQIWQKKH